MGYRYAVCLEVKDARAIVEGLDEGSADQWREVLAAIAEDRTVQLVSGR